jgi:hypothetical protein
MLVQMLGIVILAFSMMTITASEMLSYEERVAAHSQNNLVNATMENAKQQLLALIQKNIASGTTTAPVYTQGTFCPGPTTAGATCPFTEQVTYTEAGSTTTPAQTGGAQVVADNLNTNTGESRVSYQIVASVNDSHGALIGTHTGFLTLRTYNQSPYADIVGFTDNSANTDRQAQQADSAGCSPSAMNLCDTYGTADQNGDPNDPTLGDTRVTAVPTCVPSANFTCSGATPPPNTYSTTVWTNANAGGQ